MPFDGRDNTPVLKRARLIEALRAEMPKGFAWDYGCVSMTNDCGTVGCALGLAMILWPDERWRQSPGAFLRNYHQLGKFFGIPGDVAYDVFQAPDHYGFAVDEYHRVTPAMVADALERLS